MIKVQIVADSVNNFGDRLTSLVLTYPRIIHSEMMTHRMFSRNASSSRAVPVDKMIKAVRENTFCPFEFQKSHKGMQGSEYFTGVERQECVNLWLESAEFALQQAEKMKAKGISKQIINRILEPYQYYTVLITGSKEGWDNFFSLRMPEYHLENVSTINEDLSLNSRTLTLVGKSKKELLKQINEIDNDSYTEFKNVINNYSDLDWLSINKGQAEIHMMALAEAMWDAYNESKPKQLQAGEWHIPLCPEFLTYKEGEQIISYKPNPAFSEEILDCVKVATANCARTSYTVVGEKEKVRLSKEDLLLHDRLLESGHMSPFEHCARAMSEEEFDKKSKGWSGNFRGFIQYRKTFNNENITT